MLTERSGEVAMLLMQDEEDIRNAIEQSLEDILPEQTLRSRELIKTNQPYPTIRFEERLPIALRQVIRKFQFGIIVDWSVGGSL